MVWAFMVFWEVQSSGIFVSCSLGNLSLWRVLCRAEEPSLPRWQWQCVQARPHKDQRWVLQALSDTGNVLSWCVLQAHINSLSVPWFFTLLWPGWIYQRAEQGVQFSCLRFLHFCPPKSSSLHRDANSNYKSSHTTCLLKLLSHSVFFYPCYLMFASIFYLLHIIQVLQ